MVQSDTSNITFSFVVPIHNEQAGLEHFLGRLTAVAKELGESYEIIFVDDGSTDETPMILARLVDADRHVRVVEFSRNFGHQVAVTAGYDFARGQAVISLDGDCQHPPETIPQLVARWREGFEVVRTVRRDTEGISAVRRGIGRLVYRVIRLCTGADLTDQADFRLLDRKAVDALRPLREKARFVRGLVEWIGFRQTTVSYVAERREKGASSYTLGQLARMSAAGVFNFSVVPLRLSAAAGGVMFAVAVLYAVISLVLWPLGAAPSGGASFVMLLIGLFGMQFLFLGLLGEYIGRIFEEAKARPIYVVRETLGFEDEPPAEEPDLTEELLEEEPSGINVFT